MELVTSGDSRTRRPRDFAVGGQWPYAKLADSSGAEHYGARVAQEIACRLAEAMQEQGLSANRLARASGVNRQTISNVLAGVVWCDLLTIANLQRALRIRMLPDAPDGDVRFEQEIKEHGHLAAPVTEAGTSE
ncbi:helix-turn-helix transcriptional regulator [Spirillospora sp. NPDC046719]